MRANAVPTYLPIPPPYPHSCLTLRLQFQILSVAHQFAVPSVVVILAYIPFLALVPWRLWQSVQRRRVEATYYDNEPYDSNATGRAPKLVFLFVRLLVFVLVRTTSMIIRAVQAADSYPPNPFASTAASSLPLLITEQVLISTGSFLLLEVIQELLISHLSYLPSDGGVANRLKRITRLSVFVIILAVILSSVAASEFQSAENNPGKAASLKNYKLFADVVGIVVAGFNSLVAAYLLRSRPWLSRPASIFILVCSVIIGIIPCYRTSTLEHPSQTLADSIDTSTKFWFYAVDILLAVAMLVGWDIGELFTEKAGLAPSSYYASVPMLQAP